MMQAASLLTSLPSINMLFSSIFDAWCLRNTHVFPWAVVQADNVCPNLILACPAQWAVGLAYHLIPAVVHPHHTHCAVATDAIIEMIFNPKFEPVQIGAHCDHDIKNLERKLVNGHTWKQSLAQSWTDHSQVCWYWQTDGSCPSNWWTKLSIKLMDKLMEIVTNWWKLCGLMLHKAWDKMMQNLTCKEILTISVECCFFAGLEEEAIWLQCAVWMFLL